MKHKKLTRIAACLAYVYCSISGAAESIEYDSSFLMGTSAAGIDLSRYSDGNPVQPGSYDVKIRLNDKTNSTMTIEFIDTGKKYAEACISPKILARLHVKQPELDDGQAVLQKREDRADDCLNMAEAIPQSAINFNVGDLILDITVPQAWILPNYAGYVDPSLWEDGINAATLSYRLNAWRSHNQGETTESLYSAMNAGINLGNWHFRANGNYNWQKDGDSEFEFQHRYLQRDLPFIRSQLIAGETYTTGETFDSVAIKGFRVYSDDRMLPPNMSGFSPVIRGIARTNAKVTITQGNYKIYEDVVPAGEFVIDNIIPSGYGNDLIVTIEEADGSKRTFSQPFSSVTQMLRPGVGRWDFSGGQVDDDNLRGDYNVVQGSFYYGLNNYFTGYTGIQATDSHYMAVLLGLGVNTTLGAFSVDVTQSNAQIEGDGTYQGQSYRISWNKLWGPSNTSLNLAAYRYSTSSYLGLNDALNLQDDAKYRANDKDRDTIGNYSRLRNQFTVNLNQPLLFNNQDYGSIYTNGSWTDYWNGSGSQSSYSIGYSKGQSWGSWSLTLQRSWNEDGKKDDSLYVGISVPFDTLLGKERRQTAFNSLDSHLSTDFNGNHSLNTSTSGSNDLYSYSLNANYDMNKQMSDLAGVGGYLSYQSPWGMVGGSVSADNDNSRQISLSTNGGFVLHSEGLTFSNDNFNDSSTIILVKAPGAHGARINGGGNTIDRWGYGATSSASAYRENSIGLDIADLQNDVELKSTSLKAIPRNGAVVVASFETDTRRSAIVTLHRSDNKPLPFASDVTDENGVLLGNVGQGNQAFIRGIAENGILRIQWTDNGSTQPQYCTAHYRISEEQLKTQGTAPVLLDNVQCTVSVAP